MQAYNRAGNLKRICSHPRRVRRQTTAKAYIIVQTIHTLITKLKWLDEHGFVAARERVKIAGKLKQLTKE